MPPVKISLIPSSLDLALYAGDGVSLLFNLNDSAGQPLDVTGVVAAQIRDDRADAVALADFTSDLTQGAQGIVVLSLTGDQTAGLIQQDYKQFTGFWDMQWTKNGGEPVTVLQGAVTCDPDVTR
jgi:hypothetical protein